MSRIVEINSRTPKINISSILQDLFLGSGFRHLSKGISEADGIKRRWIISSIVKIV